MALVSVLGLLFLPPAESLAAGDSVVFEWGGGPEDGIYATDPLMASSPSLVAATGKEPALSPNGQEVAYTDGWTWASVQVKSKLMLTSIDGGQPRVLWQAPLDGNGDQIGGVGFPAFSPDGKSVVFTYWPDYSGATPESPGDAEIWRVRTDGSTLQRLVDWPGSQTWASYSPDGQRLVFLSTHRPDGTFEPIGWGSPWFEQLGQIYTARRDGADPVRVSPPASAHSSRQLVAIGAPSFSPDGQKVLFHADPRNCCSVDTPYIYSIGATGGSEATKLVGSSPWYPPSGLTAGGRNPTWTADGTAIMFETPHYHKAIAMADANGANKRVIWAQGAMERRRPSQRPAGSAGEGLEFLAHKFRPLVYFDDDEHWRPLDIDKFLGEGHQVCDPDPVTEDVYCTPVNNVAGFASAPYNSSWLDINGSAYDDGEEASYRTPNASCVVDALRDCENGSTSAVYFDMSKISPEGYRYLNYWFFYRFNDFADSSEPGAGETDHEGDWENVAVAIPDSDPLTFDFVNFAQHGHHFNYLRANLACDSPAGDVAGGGTPCGPTSWRVHAYPARGSHATYPDICPGFPEVCSQSTGLPEAPHDGGRPWGANADYRALKPFPAGAAAGVDWLDGPQTFVDWPGRWGSPIDGWGNGPESPGRQSSFLTPWENQCAPGNENWACAARARRQHGASRVRRAKGANSCATWFGPSVRALACAPRALRTSVARRRLGRKSSFGIRLRPRHGYRGGGRRSSATGPGIAQLVGAPLRPGDELVITGRAPHGTRLYVRGRADAKLTEVVFRPKAVAGRRTVVRVRSARRYGAGGSAARRHRRLTFIATTDGGHAVRPRTRRVSRLGP